MSQHRAQRRAGTISPHASLGSVLGSWLCSRQRRRAGVIRPGVARALLGAAVFPLVLPLLLHCAAGAAGTGDRYPEKKRPDAPRSASDDEVLGAQRQDPADTLEGSLTNEHGAARSPHAEEPEAESAHERLEHEQCVEASKAAAMPGTEARKRPVCPPAPRE